ncbi:MAG TPA: SMC-Scp complex subunit ScpB [Armatimonadota bacterium]|jgi:segregation and condensation protein B|nr:SMC-Scp complex subunit ScpB [Armatimonadota bacterium]
MSDNGTAELAKAIECVLFASAETLSTQRLGEIVEAEADAVEGAMEAVHDLLNGRGLQLVLLAGGYQLATRPEYANYVHRLLQPVPARLSTQALEVLAIIAYRQPITRPEVDDVRGVNSQHSVATLAEKGLVTTIGRKDAPGRPVLYGTTPHFLSSFGLKDLEDLPNLQALRQAVLNPPPSVLSGVSQTGETESEAVDEAPTQSDSFGAPSEAADQRESDPNNDLADALAVVETPESEAIEAQSTDEDVPAETDDVPTDDSNHGDQDET